MPRGRITDLTGKRVGRLVAVRMTDEKGKHTSAKMWECVCDCGQYRTVRSSMLISNGIKSCGQCSYSNNVFIDREAYIEGRTTKGEPFYFDKDDASEVTKFSWSYDRKGYLRGRAYGKYQLLHRFLLNPLEKEMVDHINGIKHDNRRGNLRIVNAFQNMSNSVVSKTKKTSKYKGVYYTDQINKYRVIIFHEGVRHHIGYFHSEYEAALAYDRKAIELQGEYAKLNIRKE